MIALSLSDVSLSFGTDVILKDISFSVNEGDRVGVIGVNGAGKTSLFRIINGTYDADTGGVYIQKGKTVGMLEQNPDLSSLPKNMTCREYMYTAFENVIKLEEQILAVEDALSSLADRNSDETMRLSELLLEKNRQYENCGGLEFRSRCRGLLLRLGFEEETIERRIDTLSGGQYTRLALARLLATEPDILMLDEPTNHLDIDALAWLEGFIANYKKTVIVISHDRYFLDKTTNKTLQIQYGAARLFHGNYTATKQQQEAEAASIEKRYKEQQKEIARIRANIEFQRRCNREHNFVTIRSKEKQLERMEKIELAPKAPKDIRIQFNSLAESTGDVLELKGVSFGYGERELIKNLSFLVRKNERVMVLGPNGCGKSTLMKLINSRLCPTEGRITLGYNIKIGYYDQENRGLSMNKTVFEEMHDEYPEKTNLELRSALALFRFCGDDVDKPISTLSGGERARLTLAKLMLKPVNLLIMDEPTNHLDIGSCDALEAALAAFDGTVVAVSHDRYFINKIATRIIELSPERENGMMDYLLNEDDDAFAEYLEQRESRRTGTTLNTTENKTTDAKADYEQKKQQNAEKRKNERKIERATAKIAELEAEIARLDEELFGEAASDYVRAAEIDKRKNEIEEELLSLYEIVM